MGEGLSARASWQTWYLSTLWHTVFQWFLAHPPEKKNKQANKQSKSTYLTLGMGYPFPESFSTQYSNETVLTNEVQEVYWWAVGKLVFPSNKFRFEETQVHGHLSYFLPHPVRLKLPAHQAWKDTAKANGKERCKSLAPVSLYLQSFCKSPSIFAV